MLGSSSVLVSSASTILFFGVIAVVVLQAPGSEIVGERFFSPYHLGQSFLGTGSTPSVVGAFLLNVEIFVISEVCILVLALAIAIVRGIPGPVLFPFRAVAIVYTDVFRGVPLILVLYVIGFGVPGLGLGFFSDLSDVTYGIIALVLVYSAYVAEVYRAGIETCTRVKMRRPARSVSLAGNR